MNNLYIVYSIRQDMFFVETPYGSSWYNTMGELVEAYPYIIDMEITIVNYY